MEQKDYYKILGIEKNATDQQIKNVYRRLAFKYHPDRNILNSETVEKMKSVNEAYAVLSNPKKRSEYDLLRQQFGYSAHQRFRKNYSDQDIFSGSDLDHIFEEMAKTAGLRGFDDIFKEFYGPKFRTFEFHRPGLFGRGFVFFSRKAVLFLFNKLTGNLLPEKGQDITDTIYLYPSLAQKGGPYAYYLRGKSKKLIVQIPQGIKNRQKIRLSSLGKKGKGGGPAGDLYLKVCIRKSLVRRLKDTIFGIFWWLSRLV